MARLPIVLIPPSEGKAPGGDGPPWAAGTGVVPALDGARAEVLAALGGGVAEAPTLPAVRRYDGVLYRELAYAGLPAPVRRRLDRTVLTFSALVGVAGPRDPLPDHRLKMTASLPGLGRLAGWWRPRLTVALARPLAGRVVWDLLPHEHAAAWRPEEVPMARRITVRFLDADGKVVSHWNKLLKGSLVAHVVAEGLTDPAALADFRHPSGYRFDPRASDLDGPVASVVLRARR